jgi:hypothetical protein
VTFASLLLVRLSAFGRDSLVGGERRYSSRSLSRAASLAARVNAISSRRPTIATMCFDTDSHPPIPPLAGAAVDGQRIELTCSDGTRFAAFKAVPSTPSGAGIVILPDVRGLYTF